MNLSGGGNNVGSAEINDDSIVNDDINSSAGIEKSKLNLGVGIESDDTDPALVQQKTVSLSSADILALHTTPKELIAAPGAGKIVVVDQIVYSFSYGGTQYTGGAILSPKYDGGSTSIFGNSTLNGFSNSIINGAADYVSARGLQESSVPEYLANTAITLSVGSAFADGNGTLKLFIDYKILTL